jgi:hypothetical protein
VCRQKSGPWSIFVSRVFLVVVGGDSKSTDATLGKRTTAEIQDVVRRIETTCETVNDRLKNSQDDAFGKIHHDGAIDCGLQRNEVVKSFVDHHLLELCFLVILVKRISKKGWGKIRSDRR